MERISRLPGTGLAQRVLFGALIICGLLQSTCSLFAETFFINVSHSIPVGLYLRQEREAFQVGDTVVLKVSEQVRNVAMRVGLLERTKLLFKRIQAGPGDQFCFERGVLRVGENEFGLKRKTSKGVALPRGRGCSVLSHSEYLVVGDTEDSFDSRYFGAVGSQDVVAAVKPIFTF